MISKRIVWVAAILLAAVWGCSHNEKNYVEIEDESTSAPNVEKDASVEKTIQTKEAPVESASAETATKDANLNMSTVAPKFDDKGVSVDLTGVNFDGIDDPNEFGRWAKVKVVRGSGVLTPNALKTFSKMFELTEFLWRDAQVSDEANVPFCAFAGLPKLKKVRLTNCRYVDRDEFPHFVFALGINPNLEELDLSGSPTRADELAALNYEINFQKLTRLNLYRTKIGDAGVKGILPLKDRLVWLNVDDAGITPEAATSLEQFKKLTFLHVGRSTLDDSCVESLAKLTNLKKIHVTRCGITESGADRLRRALPNCEVVSVPEK